MRNISILLLGAVLTAAGCGNRITDGDFDAADGNAGFIASEIAAMGLAALDAADSEPAVTTAKTAAVTTDTLRDIDIVWTEDAGTWVRTAHARYANAVRTRTDTLKFFDVDGTLLQRGQFGGGAVDSVCHLRSTDITGTGGNTYTARLRMGIRINRTAAGTTAVKNGGIEGTYNGIQLRTVNVTDVTYPRTDDAWRFPESGTVDIDRPLRSILITYTGNGGATAEVTNKARNRTHTVLVDVESGSETD